MKLLTAPGWTQETITSDDELVPFIETQTRFNPLGLLGVGPMFKTRQVRTVRHMPGLKFAGRRSAIEVKIDFEDTDAWVVTWIRDEGRDDGRYERTQQNTDGFILSYGSKNFRLYSILPCENLHDNVWRCSMDHFVELKDGRVD